MPDAYGQLLDATIQHLEDLKSRGARHVAVAPETLRALAQPAKTEPKNPMPTSTPTLRATELALPIASPGAA
jgi:hypothetical protein